MSKFKEYLENVNKEKKIELSIKMRNILRKKFKYNDFLGYWIAEKITKQEWNYILQNFKSYLRDLNDYSLNFTPTYVHMIKKFNPEKI